MHRFVESSGNSHGLKAFGMMFASSGSLKARRGDPADVSIGRHNGQVQALGPLRQGGLYGTPTYFRFQSSFPQNWLQQGKLSSPKTGPA